MTESFQKIATERHQIFSPYCTRYRPSFQSSQSKIFGQEAKIIQQIPIQSNNGQFLQSGMVQLMHHIPQLAFGQKTGPSYLLLAKQYFMQKQQRPPNIKPKLLQKHPNPKNIEKINRLFPNEEKLIPIYYYRFTKGYIFKNEREKYLFYQKIKNEIGLNENLSSMKSFLKIQFIPLITKETNTQDQIKQYVVKISLQSDSYRKKNIIQDETVQKSGYKEKLKYTLIYQNKADQKQWKKSTKLLLLKQKKIYTKQLILLTKLDQYLFFSHQQSKKNQMKMFQILDEHFKNLKIPDMKRFRVSKILRIQQKKPQRLEKIIQQILQKIPVGRPIYGYKICQNSDINYYFDFKNQQEAASAAVYVWMKNTNFQFVNKEEDKQQIKWEQPNIFEQATIQRFKNENYSLMR